MKYHYFTNLLLTNSASAVKDKLYMHSHVLLLGI